jgi:hypothetical protein
MSRLKLFLILLIVAPTCYLSAQEKMALVIGNADYEHLEELKNPVNDAQGIANALTQVGFEVDVYTNLTKENFKSVIRAFGEKAKGTDVFLFYYAGHGLEILGKNYFVPIDAEASSNSEIKKNCVPASAITNYMKFIGSENNIIILDACRSNPFVSDAAGESGGLALMDAPTGTIISFATAPGKVALDGSGENGVYTSALLEHILTYDLDIKDVFERVRNSVVEASNNKQIPWESTSLTTELVLRRKPELPIQVNILEGDSITYEGSGQLHATSNLQGVSFSWYYNGRQFSNIATPDVNRTGNYQVKVISREGQILLSEPIWVTIKSFVDPVVYIEEGTQITFDQAGVLHGKTNVKGTYKWLKDNNYVGDGSSLEVSVPGLYNFQINTEDGRSATSESIKVRITNE